MKAFFERLWSRKSPRPASARRPTARLQLEALETRLTPSTAAVQTAVLKVNGELDLYNTQTGVFQMLSPAGTIGSVSAAQTAGGQTVVFAVATDTDATGNLNTLWKYNAAAGGWSEISTGYFQQVSAATNAAGDAVVFGVLGQGAFTNYVNSLWEYSGGVWKDIAQGVLAITPHYVTSVSAVGTAQGEVAFAIASDDQSLWEYTPAGGWTTVSPGTFKQVSAGLDANGQADAFGLVNYNLWRFDNNVWTQVAGYGAPSALYFSGPSFVVGATASRNGEVFAISGLFSQGFVNSITSSGPLFELGASDWTELSSSFFSQVSVTQTSAGADVVFGTLFDGSLWEFTGGGMTELLSGGVASTSAP